MSDPSTAAPDLGRFFRPRKVVVVGASERPGAPTTVNWRLLRRWAERAGAEIVPVNPRRSEVDGLACVARLGDVPGEIDVVASLVADVEPVVRDAVAAHVAFVVVFSAGFAETGADGARDQERLAALVRGTGTRLLGPNTNLNAFEQFRDDLDGPAIALISQSGHQGRPLFMLQENGVRVSHWAPTGNEADLDASDFIRWFADQAGIGVVATYLEGIAHGSRFVDAARHAVATGTPVAAVKVGRTAVGRSGVASHTGKLAGSDAVADAVFRQLGVIRVDTLDQLADTATLLARGGRPRASGVAVYSISGGTGAHVADLCGAGGLDVPMLASATRDALHQWIPSYLSVTNPIDCGGPPVGDSRGRKILDAIVADPAIGVLLCAVTGPFPPLSDRLAADLAALAADTDVAVCVIWGSPVGTEPALREVLFGSERLVVFRSAANAVRAIADWQGWHAFRARQPGTTRVASSAVSRRSPRRGAAVAPWRPRADHRATGQGWATMLSEWEAGELLREYGVPTAPQRLCSNMTEAVRAAREFGGPVVMKACAPSLAHKSDLGLVAVGVAGPTAVRTTFRQLVERASRHGVALDGVLVAEHQGSGLEPVVGVIDDEVFGPTVMVGMGGVEVEVVPDVTFRVPPFGRAEVRFMLGELRSAARFGRVRNQPGVDLTALTDLVVRVGDMAVDLRGHLLELDLNPVLVRRGRGQGAVVLDALATWSS